MATLDLSFPKWPLPGPSPALGADAVHVWRIDLDAHIDADLLSREETACAALMKHEGARATFRQARHAMRLILSAYTGVAPVELPIVISRSGKPELALGGAPFFNLSHSGRHALLAVARVPVGVDVEALRPAPRLEDLARRFFAPREAAALGALPEPDRLDAFYACWTRKEAFVKVDGSGIAHALGSFEVSVGPEAPAQLLSIEGDAARARAMTLHAFRLDAAWGAVCVAAPEVVAHGFELRHG